MLLLVLILVLIAFSLLVVALLTGSVLWAWVSVGVSVAAAAVLLVDYLQRRSAVRAGAEAGAAAGPSRQADMEPVTEVLPVIPRSGSADGAQPDSATAMFDQSADSQQTVVMPIVQPPASTDRPSGASPEASPSSGSSSPTVTAAGVARSPSGAAPGDAGAGSPGADGGAPGTPEAAATTTAAAGGDKSADATAMVATSNGGPAGDGPGEPAKDVNGASGPAQDSAPAAAEEEPPEEPRDAAAAAVVAGLESEVLVVDEQPRYHVTGCRALSGRALIPIPAREAVELGFTPCGWCTPDRTLAAQHAPAR